MPSNTPVNHRRAEEEQRRKKCHGNRKSQRFRRKWRARGIPSASIEKMIKNRKRVNDRRHRRSNDVRTTTAAPPLNRSTVHRCVQSQPLPTTTTTTTERMSTATTSNCYKRKKDCRSQQELSPKQSVPNSVSTSSLVQPTTKRKKKQKGSTPSMLATVNSSTIQHGYRFVLLCEPIVRVDFSY